jgi:hypothetical protein
MVFFATTPKKGKGNTILDQKQGIWRIEIGLEFKAG